MTPHRNRKPATGRYRQHPACESNSCTQQEEGSGRLPNTTLMPAAPLSQMQCFATRTRTTVLAAAEHRGEDDHQRSTQTNVLMLTIHPTLASTTGTYNTAGLQRNLALATNAPSTHSSSHDAETAGQRAEQPANAQSIHSHATTVTSPMSDQQEPTFPPTKASSSFMSITLQNCTMSWARPESRRPLGNVPSTHTSSLGQRAEQPANAPHILSHTMIVTSIM